MAITYAQETGLTAEEYIACVGQTTLGASRPLGNVERVQAMIDESDLVVTARAEDGTLLGLSRTITDWHWVAYCMDLAVVETQQGGGIGKIEWRVNGVTSGVDACRGIGRADEAQNRAEPAGSADEQATKSNDAIGAIARGRADMETSGAPRPARTMG